MNFPIPANATQEEIEAIIEQGMDARFDAHDAGGDGNVAFLHEERAEEGDDKSGEAPNTNNNSKHLRES
jgi:hypothetical protein